jgi:hypothetical protein
MIKKEVKILICEDESIIAMDIKNTITRLGYVVTSIVKTADELIKKTATEKPDIIISDIKLQGKSTSLEALQVISLNQKIPIIFLSGILNASSITSELAIDPCYHITKPYMPGHLKETIEKCLSGKTTRSQKK